MIRLEVNDAGILAALDRLARAVTDMRPVMQDIGEEMVVSTRDRFVAGAAPDGSPWAPKSPTTIAAYERRKDPVDLRPLFGPTRRLSSEIASYASETSVEWGSNLIYSAVMQLGAAKGAFGSTSRGGPIPWGPIPARPFLGVSDDDRNTILEALDDWLTQAWDGR